MDKKAIPHQRTNSIFKISLLLLIICILESCVYKDKKNQEKNAVILPDGSITHRNNITLFTDSLHIVYIPYNGYPIFSFTDNRLETVFLLLSSSNGNEDIPPKNTQIIGFQFRIKKEMQLTEIVKIIETEMDLSNKINKKNYLNDKIKIELYNGYNLIIQKNKFLIKCITETSNGS